LQIILEELHDIEEAIRFCRETRDQTLWTKLIEQSEGKPGRNTQNQLEGKERISFVVEFIRGLLNHAGSDIDLKQLIDKVQNDLRIPGLRDSLCKIMQDYNIQVLEILFIFKGY
jgi:hypothetical protein